MSGRIDAQLEAAQQRVRELTGRANDPFPQREELAAVQHELNTLRDELTAESDRAPTPATGAGRVDHDLGGVEL